MENKIVVKWHGSDYCLCSGEWEFSINGEQFPTPFRYGENAQTEGDYRRWYFGGESGWDEKWCKYHDGLPEKEWIAKFHSWLSTLPLAPGEYPAVYAAFQAEDWRHGSCGGCI